MDMTPEARAAEVLQMLIDAYSSQDEKEKAFRALGPWIAEAIREAVQAERDRCTRLVAEFALDGITKGVNYP